MGWKHFRQPHLAMYKNYQAVNFSPIHQSRCFWRKFPLLLAFLQSAAKTFSWHDKICLWKVIEIIFENLKYPKIKFLDWFGRGCHGSWYSQKQDFRHWSKKIISQSNAMLNFLSIVEGRKIALLNIYHSLQTYLHTIRLSFLYLDLLLHGEKITCTYLERRKQPYTHCNLQSSVEIEMLTCELEDASG